MLQYWGCTHPGVVRAQNQDTFLVEKLSDTAVLAVVCDGMGGAKSGNVASHLAMDVFAQEVRSSYKRGMSQQMVEHMLRSAVKLANFTVYEQAQQFEEFEGMGTTLVAAFLEGEYATVVNVGDSRCYSVTEKGIRQVTKDHSLVQLMVQRGELSPEKAKSYPGKNLITRAIGTETVVECDVFSQHLVVSDRLLLCSDGLSNVVDDQEILFEIVHGSDESQCCQRLLDIALNRGAPDNVTSILVRV